ncbi:MAG TPA: MarC family protein [Steroidobacteraceae bacterium]|nr:MarC family protein [Steroidobacteraceae bacterium]
MTTFLFAFTALFTIVNPLPGAFIFLGATQDLGARVRAQLSLWVAIYAFSIIAASLYVGGYVLLFFGISLPVLKVAGGIVIAVSGWRMLTGPDTSEQRRDETASALPVVVTPSRLAFYPLTMPLTTGPGTISVAISIGANRPTKLGAELMFFAETALATLLLALLVYVFYRYSERLARVIGPTGTTVVVRLTAFLLFCIGIQVLWTGLEQLLSGATIGISLPES